MSVVFNIACGKVAEYAARVNANDPANSALLVIPVLTAGLETEAVLRDKDTVADVFSGATDEATAGGWNRKTLTDSGGITIAVDDSGNLQSVDLPDQTWTAVAAGNNVSKLLVAYDSDTTGGNDANLVPVVLLDFTVTTDGNDVVSVFHASGIFQAAGA